MLKRITSLLLCLLLVASSVLLVACGDEKTEETGSDQSNGSGDGFLNEKRDWGGETVTILGYNGKFAFSTCQIDPQELRDEPVNDAFYSRNALIEEDYGIDIVQVLPESDEHPADMLRADITSDLGEYDAVASPIANLVPIALDKLLLDFNAIDSKYLHLDQAWWDQGLMTDLDINDKIYFITGDALVDDDENTWAMYFNKDLVSKYNLEDPYQLVREGKWTIDKMYEMIKQVSYTTGSTKVFDPDSEDIWGMVIQSYDFYLFMQGCNQKMVDATGDVPELRVDSDENISTFLELCDILYDEVNVGVADHHGMWNEGIYTKERQIFANGNSLFMPGAISYVSITELRESEIHYGILPMPKRNEHQEEYTTSMTVYDFAVFSIPITNVEKLDVTCYALEAMAYYGKELVTPEYYNRTLTYKRFEDEESADMLELIFRNRIYDMGAVFNFHSTSPEGYGTLYYYTNLLAAKKRDIASSYEANFNNFQAGVDELIALAYND